MMTVQAGDVSVVVQGPPGPYLADVLGSVRRVLPGAELILSTWKGSAPQGADADVVVENDDPGSEPYRLATGGASVRLFNTNRLLRSAREGIARATRSHVLKLRTDTPLTGSSFLDWFEQPQPRLEQDRVFTRRVVTLSVATRPGDRSAAYLFHPSDCVHFGLRDDLALLWSGAEVDETENAAYWEVRDPTGGSRPFPGASARYWNEQVMWLAAVRAAGLTVDYPYTGYSAPGLAERSDRLTYNNFLVLEPWQFGVAIPKLQDMVTASDPDGYLYFDDWRRLRERFSASAA